MTFIFGSPTLLKLLNYTFLFFFFLHSPIILICFLNCVIRFVFSRLFGLIVSCVAWMGNGFSVLKTKSPHKCLLWAGHKLWEVFQRCLVTEVDSYVWKLLVTSSHGGGSDNMVVSYSAEVGVGLGSTTRA